MVATELRLDGFSVALNDLGVFLGRPCQPQHKICNFLGQGEIDNFSALRVQCTEHASQMRCTEHSLGTVSMPWYGGSIRSSP